MSLDKLCVAWLLFWFCNYTNNVTVRPILELVDVRMYIHEMIDLILHRSVHALLQRTVELTHHPDVMPSANPREHRDICESEGVYVLVRS